MPKGYGPKKTKRLTPPQRKAIIAALARCAAVARFGIQNTP